MGIYLKMSLAYLKKNKLRTEELKDLKYPPIYLTDELDK